MTWDSSVVGGAYHTFIPHTYLTLGFSSCMAATTQHGACLHAITF